MKVLLQTISRPPRFIVFSTLFFLLSCGLTGQSQSPFSGVWVGALEVQGTQLEMIFDIMEKADVLTCKMDVPLQGAKAIPADEVTQQADQISIVYQMIGGQYQGTLSADQQSITGTWNQGGQSLDLKLSKTEDKSSVTLKRPQEPKPPFPYQSEDYYFENRVEKIFLSGTLTKPSGKGPFPTAILISGSGPQDRNEEILGHKPFWVIADHLTRNGIAVFRYDDRGHGQSKGNFDKATSVHFAADVEAAMNFLKTIPDIDSTQLGLIGHSEGGLIAPMVASKRQDVAFAILLAAPGINLKEILILQSTLLSRAEGTPEEEVIRDSILNRKMLETYASGMDLKTRNEKLEETAMVYYNKLSEEEQQKLGSFKSFYAQSTKGMDTPWMHFLLTYEPSTALEKTSCPVLAINGGLDLQVPAKINLKSIEAALKKSPCQNYQVLEIPNHNHLFQKTKTGAFSEYATNEETFSVNVMELMTEWIWSLN